MLYIFIYYLCFKSESELAVREINSQSKNGMQASFSNRDDKNQNKTSQSSEDTNAGYNANDLSRRRIQGPFSEPVTEIDKSIPKSKYLVTADDYENPNLRANDPMQNYLNVDMKKVSTQGYQRLKPNQIE